MPQSLLGRAGNSLVPLLVLGVALLFEGLVYSEILAAIVDIPDISVKALLLGGFIFVPLATVSILIHELTRWFLRDKG